MYDHDFRHGVPSSISQNVPRAMARRDQQSAAEAGAEYKRSVIEHGLDPEFVVDALGQHQKLISWMAEDLRRGPYLAGDAFTNADCAVIPYILRLELLKLGGMWQREPAVATGGRACVIGTRSRLRSSIACWNPMGALPQPVA